MTTATLVTGTLTTQTGIRPRRSLEELVDRLMATLTFREEPAAAAASSLEGSWGDGPGAAWRNWWTGSWPR